MRAQKEGQPFFSRTTFAVVALLLSCMTTGCGRGPVTPGGPESVRNMPVARAQVLSATGLAWDGQYSLVVFEDPFGKCLSETLRIIRKLHFNIDTSRSRRSHDGAKLFASNEDKLLTEIQLHARSKGGTLARVKVGDLGDRNGSERFLDEIRRGLTP